MEKGQAARRKEEEEEHIRMVDSRACHQPTRRKCAPHSSASLQPASSNFGRCWNLLLSPPIDNKGRWGGCRCGQRSCKERGAFSIWVDMTGRTELPSLFSYWFLFYKSKGCFYGQTLLEGVTKSPASTLGYSTHLCTSGSRSHGR